MTKNLRKKFNIGVILLFWCSLGAHQMLHNSPTPERIWGVGTVVTAGTVWQKSPMPVTPEFFPAELCLICTGLLVSDDFNTEISLPITIPPNVNFSVVVSSAIPSPWLKTSPRSPPLQR